MTTIQQLYLEPCTYVDPIFSKTTVDGYLGKAHDVFDNTTSVLLEPEQRETLSHVGQDRLSKFTDTVKSSAKVGASLGAIASNVLMLVPDLIIGRGNQPAKGEPTSPFSLGALGMLFYGTTVAATGIAEAVGMGTGTITATVTLPVLSSTSKTRSEWFGSQMKGCSELFATSVSTALSLVFGAVLDVLRLGSLVVKSIVTFALALGATVCGALIGVIRAIVNH